MLSAAGCKSRRIRLWQAVADRINLPALVLTDPIHLRYFANFHVDPFSLGAEFGGVLVIRPDGHATLFHDRRLPESVHSAHVDETEVINWYDGQSPGDGPRRLALQNAVMANGGRIHDSFTDPLCKPITETIAGMRRRKDPDEIDVLRACMRATEAGHAWSRANVHAGMSELEVYNGIFAACSSTVGHPVIVYGDFAVSPGSSRRGGPATTQRVRDGDMLILDFSVILFGFRSDFTNTLVVGGKPNADQQRLYDACVGAMKAGEARLAAGNSCQTVYDAVDGALGAANLAQYFPHHAGHGLGLTHPEAPFFVRQSTESLIDGDVVTLEPGVYVDGIGGIRIEHNYLITAFGYERLSHHTIALS